MREQAHFSNLSNMGIENDGVGIGLNCLKNILDMMLGPRVWIWWIQECVGEEEFLTENVFNEWTRSETINITEETNAVKQV